MRKIKIVFFILSIVLLNSCYFVSLPNPPNNSNWSKVIPEFKNRSVSIYTFDNNGVRYYRGSGVIYNKKTVLTSSHIYTRTDSANQRTIFCHRFGDSLMYQLHILKKDSHKDGLMLLKIQQGYKFNNIQQPLLIGDNIEGSEACMYGSSKYFTNIAKYGKTSIIHNIYNIVSIPALIKFNYQNFIFFDINNSFKGNSGSPLYNRQGELIGIYWGEINCNDKVLFHCAVSANNIKSFLSVSSFN